MAPTHGTTQWHIPCPDSCPSFVIPCSQNWKHTEISAISKKLWISQQTRGALCSLPVQYRVKARPLTCELCCLCPWLLPPGLPRSALLQPLGACTCFQSLSACNSSLLSLNFSLAWCIGCFTVLCCQAAEPRTLEGGVDGKSIPGYNSKHVHIPQKMERQKSCFDGGIREIRV